MPSGKDGRHYPRLQVSPELATAMVDATGARVLRTIDQCSAAMATARETESMADLDDAIWRFRSAALRERLLALEGYGDTLDLSSLLTRHATALALSSPAISKLFSSISEIFVDAGEARLIVLLVDELVGVVEHCASRRVRISIRTTTSPTVYGYRLGLKVAGRGIGMKMVPCATMLDGLVRAGRIAAALSGNVVRSVEGKWMVLGTTLDIHDVSMGVAE